MSWIFYYLPQKASYPIKEAGMREWNASVTHWRAWTGWAKDTEWRHEDLLTILDWQDHLWYLIETQLIKPQPVVPYDMDPCLQLSRIRGEKKKDAGVCVGYFLRIYKKKTRLLWNWSVWKPERRTYDATKLSHSAWGQGTQRRSPLSQAPTVSSLQPEKGIALPPWRCSTGEVSPALLLLKLLNCSQVDSINQELRHSAQQQGQVQSPRDKFSDQVLGSKPEGLVVYLVLVISPWKQINLESQQHL